MAKTLIGPAREPFNFLASTTYYQTLGQGSLRNATTEAHEVRTFRSGFTASRLYAKVSVNDRGATTVRTRKNGANGNQSLTIPSSTTGEFEDTTNSDSYASGDTGNLQIVTGAGGATLQITAVLLQADATTNSTVFYTAPTGSFTTSGQTRWATPVGGSVWTNPEAHEELYVRGAVTLKHLWLYVATNARTTNNTIRVRKNGANGNQVITVTAGTTGNFEDTSNTDSLVAGDRFTIQLTTGTGTQAFETQQCSITAETTDGSFPIFAKGGAAGVTIAQNLTRFGPVVSRFDANANESPVQHDARIGMTLSNVACYVGNNTVTADSTLRLRKNGANANQVVTITASTTGLFRDTTNTDAVVATDELTYQVVTGSGGTSLAIHSFQMHAVQPAAAAGHGPLLSHQRNRLVRAA